MCSHYEAPTPHQVAEAFGVALFDQGRLDLWPGYIGPFLRRPDGRAEDDESTAAMEVLTGSIGLIPSWSKDSKFAKRTYNARSETVAEKPSFRHAWLSPARHWRKGLAKPVCSSSPWLMRCAKRYLPKA
ncbi:Orf14 [Pseudomonas syringae pv. pisi]|nr:Orf14 [Pseudomonas syringae pv. pisi]